MFPGLFVESTRYRPGPFASKSARIAPIIPLYGSCSQVSATSVNAGAASARFHTAVTGSSRYGVARDISGRRKSPRPSRSRGLATSTRSRQRKADAISPPPANGPGQGPGAADLAAAVPSIHLPAATPGAAAPGVAAGRSENFPLWDPRGVWGPGFRGCHGSTDPEKSPYRPSSRADFGRIRPRNPAPPSKPLRNRLYELCRFPGF